jgi:prepilin-type N-terminal cleavage/methylation domain-containing protein
VQKGLTLIEVLVVIVIVAILGAIGFGVAAPARESARQRACISNLKQIYLAVNLYTSDHPEAARIPQTSLAVPGLGCTTPLLPYMRSRDIFYCPSAPSQIRSKLASTYEWGLCAFDPQVLEDVDFAEMIHKKRNLLGDRFPIVTCFVHDHLSYAPKEMDLHPAYQKTFLLELRLDGSVWHGFKNEPHPATIW